MIARNPAAALWAAIASVAILFLGVTAVIGMQRPAGAGGAAGGAAAPAAQVFEQEVDGTEFAIAPDCITAPAGQPLVFHVNNTGQAEHDLTLVDGPTSGTIAPGDRGELRLDPLEAGEYTLICSLPGHAPSGMGATLVVEEGYQTAAAQTGAVESADSRHTGHDDLTLEEIVRLHDEGIAAFPAGTEAMGGQPLEPTVEAEGTKVFELTADEVGWEVSPGVFEEAYAYNGTVPGPRIDVEVGDRVRVVLHHHGQIVPAEMDGVPGLTQPAVLPGESFTYDFTVRNAGSHMYHSHFDSAEQVPMGSWAPSWSATAPSSPWTWTTR